ncbi:glycine-rich RNA-binding protein 2, mitochondrial-like [Impatiens glandulifera]|uniref:glycine-rich RNA-binding protein 2, mitochondrial-like n=1 Tax=Impatiens glandulifera TaxID=253017 RepID=UPI001FB11905|nr:glycine-rich RNA-binding protein 2, mitochondrial-like [Impatiens glandulifera]
MAFLSKVGSILRQSISKNINAQNISASNPSILQTIRCMSSSKVFVGGLSFSTDETSLKEAFTRYGEVVEARVISDRETGRSRGFGFVTFCSAEEASASIQALDGQELHGRTVRVNYANDRPRTFGGGGGYGGGGGGYGGGGYGGGGGGYGGGGGGYGGGGYGGGGYGGGNDGGGGYGGGNNQNQAGGYYGGGNQGGFGGGSELGLGGLEQQSSGGFENAAASSGGFGHHDTLDKDDGDDKPDDYASRRA